MPRQEKPTTQGSPDFSNMTNEELKKYAADTGGPQHPDDPDWAVGAGVQPALDTDFNLNDEYKDSPLIPGGNYRANIVAVAHEASKYAIAFKVVMVENGGLMSDGNTPIDGAVDYFRVWLPKIGDENELTSSGRMSKRQSKVNMMKRFADKLEINMNTKEDIARAIVEGEWVGIPVIVAVDIEEYLGVVRNRIQSMVKDTSRL